jgi:hypothetical protein
MWKKRTLLFDSDVTQDSRLLECYTEQLDPEDEDNTIA